MSRNSHRVGLLATACTVMAVTAVSAPAATITWTSAQDSSQPSDVDTSGSLVEAVNATVAQETPGSVTVNGVQFINDDSVLPEDAGGRSFLAGNSTGDPNLDALLDKLDFGGGTSTSISLGGGNLVPDNPYRLQVWFTDLRGCCSGRVMTFGDGETPESTVDLDSAAGGFGQFAIGTFTADATTQTLSLTTNGFGNAHITAY